MKPKAPPTKRRFENEGHELDYCYDQILYWWYEREDLDKAQRFADRFEALLQSNFSEHEAIVGEEYWSLLSELRGDLPAAIRYREHEIELILRIWELSADTPSFSHVLRVYGVEDFSDRLDLLAILYYDSGDLDKAIATLARSKWICESFRAAFEGEDLLRDYLFERSDGPRLLGTLRKQGWKFLDEARAKGPLPGARPSDRRPGRLRREGRRRGAG